MIRGALHIRLISALLLLVALAALAGCGDPPTLTPQEVIAKAVPAMKDVQSMHFSLTTSKLETYPAGLYITGADGDVVKPDQLQATAKAILLNTPIEVKVVGVASNQFMTDPASGRWGKMAAGFNVIAAFDPDKGIADILSNLQSPTSDGSESIDGVASYRLKGAIPPDALKALVPDVSASQPLNATLWIGSDDFRLRQVVLVGSLIAGEPASVSRTIKFSNFNTAPAIVTPVIGTTP